MSLWKRSTWALVLAGLMALGLSACGLEGEENDIGDSPLLMDVDVLLDGAPDKADLVDEKTDLVPPRQFDLMQYQSPVRNQRSRGVCSIFATVALMEHLYIKEGTYRTPDFSEQYLQWSAKVELGSFTHTEGSSADSNLKAINRFGIVEERDWPYDATRWTASNDPACVSGEDNLPVKCYTNGDPPQAARDAKKWKLPASRWVSATANSIKAFMVNKGQAVNVGGTFYYQAWNHGASTLPVRSDYSRKGYVLFPNAKDREESLKKRAGHAFLLVGWDDDLEVQSVDENGQLEVDAQGNPVMQKGFFLFKNSWGTGRFGVENPKGDGYGWIAYRYVAELSAVAADVPKVDAPINPENCTNAIDDDRDGKTDCDDSDCAEHAACKAERLLYENATPAAIPDNNASGISSTIDVSLDALIGALDVSVDINHTYRGDLEIRLIHPDGTDFQVHAPDSSSGDDIKQTFPVAAFNGKRTLGRWTLRVIDRAAQDTGTLNRWSLRFQTQSGGQTVTIGDCRLESPASFTATPGQSFQVKGRLFVAGLTDRTTGVDAHASLVGQVGRGARGSTPGSSWTWALAAATPGWNDSVEPGYDEYQASISAPSTTGDYAYALRFSGDGGQTWTACDLDGSQNGYQSAQAGALTVSAQQTAARLLFSEYVEGSSYNKAIEVANLGSSSASLDGCQIRVYLNGSPTPSRTADLSGSLAGRGTFVLCHPSASAAVLSRCQLQNGAVANFNGDDALDLVCNGQVLDVFGRIGEDPGTAWGSGATSTLDKTLRRKCSVTQGDPNGSDAFDPAVEWDGFAKDVFDGLGNLGC
jgi:subtilisin-like proprotein convertase family protein/C1A family cysteine protease